MQAARGSLKYTGISLSSTTPSSSWLYLAIQPRDSLQGLGVGTANHVDLTTTVVSRQRQRCGVASVTG